MWLQWYCGEFEAQKLISIKTVDLQVNLVELYSVLRSVSIVYCMQLLIVPISSSVVSCDIIWKNDHLKDAIFFHPGIFRSYHMQYVCCSFVLICAYFCTINYCMAENYQNFSVLVLNSSFSVQPCVQTLMQDSTGIELCTAYGAEILKVQSKQFWRCVFSNKWSATKTELFSHG